MFFTITRFDSISKAFRVQNSMNITDEIDAQKFADDVKRVLGGSTKIYRSRVPAHRINNLDDLRNHGAELICED
jgi:hypothetical protein